MSASQVPTVSLLEHEPQLAAAVPQEDAELAARVLTLPCVHLARGAWTPSHHESAFGLLICEGLMTREVLLADRSSAQLHGPGDVISPWADESVLVPSVTRWSVNLPVLAAVLDGRFITAARRWPGLFELVHERLGNQCSREALHTGISQLGRVEQRVLAALWHLAERFGRVTPDGVIVPLRLTHEAIGRLVGAQRPTVTLALGALAADGVVKKRDDGAWLLLEGSQAILAPPPDALPPRERATATVAVDADDTHAVEAPVASEIAELRDRLQAIADGHSARVEEVHEVLERCRATMADGADARRRVMAGREERLSRSRPTPIAR